MKNKLYVILILLLLSCNLYGQKTKLIFVQSLKVNYSENPIDSNKPFSFKLLKNKKGILKNNRADTLYHFSFDLDTLTAISFEFHSDTILITNACEYFGDSVFGTINLTPNYNTNCILIEFLSYIDPSETYQSIIPSDKEFNDTKCNEYKYFFTDFAKKNINYIKDFKSYVKLK